MQRKTRSANIGTRLLYGQQLLVLHVSKLYMHVVSVVSVYWTVLGFPYRDKIGENEIASPRRGAPRQASRFDVWGEQLPRAVQRQLRPSSCGTKQV